MEIITDDNGNQSLSLNLQSDTITMATANTYVDKNIVVNVPLSQKADLNNPSFIGIPTAPTATAKTSTLQIANTKFVNDNFVQKTGDTMTGPLKFNTTTLPILDLHLNKEASNVYTMTTNGSLFIGDGTSTGGARVYYCRKVEKLGLAVLSAVSVGYNPQDQSNWSNSVDYGIKFDVNMASPTSATPSSLRQCASFFVGVNVAVVGYSGSANTPLAKNAIYTVLDSNNVKNDAYIKSLESRITELENKLNNIEGD